MKREWRKGDQIVMSDGMTAADYAESHGAPRDAEVGVVVDDDGNLVETSFKEQDGQLDM